MKTWIENFRPHMIIYKEYPLGGSFLDEVIIVRGVCADRVFRARLRIAIRKNQILGRPE